MNTIGKVNKSKIIYYLSYNLFLEKNKNKGQNKFDESQYFTTTGISTNIETDLSQSVKEKDLEPAYKNTTKIPLKMNSILQNYNEQPVHPAK